MTTTAFEVLGMTCGGCAKSVSRCIQSVAHVQSVIVDHTTHRATATWVAECSPDDQQMATQAICAAVEAAGFECRPL
jgi:copper chaperone CopZ